MDWIKVYTDCIDFAARKHRDQRRMDDVKTPYINHPIGVARILSEEADVTGGSIKTKDITWRKFFRSKCMTEFASSTFRIT